MDEAEEARLERALGTPHYADANLDDVNASLLTIAVTLEEIKEKIGVVIGCLVIIAFMIAIYFWKTGLFN